MKKASIALLLLLAFLSAMGQAPSPKIAPYTFQGNILGVTTSEQLTMKAGASKIKCQPSSQGIQNCAVDSDNPAWTASYYVFVDDRLASVTFDFSDVLSLAQLLQALTAKFGTPVVTTADYQNEQGATVTAHDYKWDKAADGIHLEEQGYGNPMGFGHLSYQDKKLMDTWYKRKFPPPSL